MSIIAFKPLEKKDEYIDLIKRIFNENNCDLIDFDKSIKSKNFNFDIAYLNWFEYLPHKNFIKNFLSFMKKIVILKKLKRKNKKIIYVCHNLSSHSKYGRRMSNYLIKKCLKNATYVASIIEPTFELLSTKYKLNSELKKKFFYVSIPNYEIKKYLTQSNSENKKIKLVYFGLIRPYKNIELIIELAKLHNNIEFYVAGSANQEYKDKIISLAKGIENIYFEFKYFSDDDLYNYIQQYDAVILPYNKESMLNSGAFRLAAILKKSIICPKIGNSFELDNDNYYFYDYDLEKNHFKKLNEAIIKLENDWNNNQSILSIKGEKAFIEHSKKYSYEIVKQRYEELLKECVSK